MQIIAMMAAEGWRAQVAEGVTPLVGWALRLNEETDETEVIGMVAPTSEPTLATVDEVEGFVRYVPPGVTLVVDDDGKAVEAKATTESRSGVLSWGR